MAEHAKGPPGRIPVPEDLPEDLPEGERRAARLRLVAGRRLAGLTVALDGVHDPHNISAVLRSCDGFGLQHVHLIPPRTPPSNDRRRLNRSISKGCERWLDIHRYASPTECIVALRAEGFELWAAMPDRHAPMLEEVDFSRKVALVFGAERDGLSDELLDACDGRYQLPMPGFSQSLNVSVAAAISIYVAARERRRILGRLTDLDEATVRALTERWMAEDEARRRG